MKGISLDADRAAADAVVAAKVGTTAAAAGRGGGVTVGGVAGKRCRETVVEAVERRPTTRGGTNE